MLESRFWRTLYIHTHTNSQIEVNSFGGSNSTAVFWECLSRYPGKKVVGGRVHTQASKYVRTYTELACLPMHEAAAAVVSQSSRQASRASIRVSDRRMTASERASGLAKNRRNRQCAAAAPPHLLLLLLLLTEILLLLLLFLSSSVNVTPVFKLYPSIFHGSPKNSCWPWSIRVNSGTLHVCFRLLKEPGA